MPAETEINNEPIVLTDEASAFLERVEADRAANAGPRFRVNTELRDSFSEGIRPKHSSNHR